MRMFFIFFIGLCLTSFDVKAEMYGESQLDYLRRVSPDVKKVNNRDYCLKECNATREDLNNCKKSLTEECIKLKSCLLDCKTEEAYFLRKRLKRNE